MGGTETPPVPFANTGGGIDARIDFDINVLCRFFFRPVGDEGAYVSGEVSGEVRGMVRGVEKGRAKIRFHGS